MQTLIHAFVMCRVDYLNSLIVGVQGYALNRLQMVLNNAAQLVERVNSTSAHITSFLSDLHWLPIQARIDYKILLLTYTALNYLGSSYLVHLSHFKVHKISTRSSLDNLLLDTKDSF